MTAQTQSARARVRHFYAANSNICERTLLLHAVRNYLYSAGYSGINMRPGQIAVQFVYVRVVVGLARFAYLISRTPHNRPIARLFASHR